MPAPTKARLEQMTVSRGAANLHDGCRGFGWPEGHRFELQTQAMFMSMPGATLPDASDNRPRPELFEQARRTVNRGAAFLPACTSGPTVAASALLSVLAVGLIRVVAARPSRIASNPPPRQADTTLIKRSGCQ